MMRVMPGRSGSSPLAMSSVKIAVLRLCSSGISVAAVLAVGPAGFVEVVRHPLLTARDLEQLAVEVDVPLGVDAGCRERAVERDTMAVSLGVDEHTVAIEDQGLHHGAAEREVTRLSKEARCRGSCRRTARSFP